MTDEIKKMLAEIKEKRSSILEEFSRAYLAETGLDPSQVQLVETVRTGGVTWHFEPKRKRAKKERV